MPFAGTADAGAGREPHGPADQDRAAIPSIRSRAAAPTSSPRRRSSTLYDPDRSQTVIGTGEIRPWSELSLALTSAGAGQTGRSAAPACGSCTEHGHLADARGADRRRLLTASARRRSGSSTSRSARDNARAGARLAFGEYVEPRLPHRPGRRDPLARRRLPRRGPRQAALRARTSRRAAASCAGQTGDEPALRRREHRRPTPASKADHRLPLKAARRRGRWRGRSPPALGVAGCRRRRRRDGGRRRSRPRSSRICRRIAAARWSSPASTSRPPSTRWRTR